ncbi:transcriptional regulator HexR [Idiomarina seosinensis]|uniref:transcriptional regulator HexR n=1 Tax=Idiomarina seosinensis TaxID=281739 RepID=UPI00384FDFB2
MNIVQTVKARLPDLSKNEYKVAQQVLQAPEAAIHHTTASLAKIADVSEPTINRFCRRIGCKGFPDFKLQLAQQLAVGSSYVSSQINDEDSITQAADKVFASTLSALSKAQEQLDYEAIEQTIAYLSKARKIAFFGFGASASVAHDAQNKFARFTTPAIFSDDLLVQKVTALNSLPADVIILFSHTGRTKALCEIAQLAFEHEATVIGITAQDSPLAEFCHVVVSTEVPEDTDQYLPMSSRIAQMVLIDAIVAGFALAQGEVAKQQLARVKAGLKDSRYPITKNTQ